MSRCGSRRSTSHRRSTRYGTTHYGKALARFKVELPYISLLKRLYAEQQATVLTDKESDVFKIQRGTKQWVPLSSLLFNTVLQVALEDELKTWHEKGMGISLGDHTTDCLSNLRFTDNVHLFSISLEQLKRTMRDFKWSTERVGLKIHPDKTQILSNQRSNKQSEATIDDIKVEVLSISVKANYLG